jgi:peptidoglycan hydrolase-like protein with peptidoglycan-binding domain
MSTQGRRSKRVWRRRVPALMLASAVVAAACSGGSNGGLTTAFTGTTTPPVSTTEPVEATVPVTTAAPAATPTTGPPPPPPPLAMAPSGGLGPGARGEQVRMLEQRLDALRFDVGPLDDVYDVDTAHAVTAYQKLHGLPRSGRATQDVLASLASAQPPPPLVPGGGATRVEIDLSRQVLFLYQGDALHRTLPVSTGTGKRFCADGECGVAITPTGSFRVERRIQGWRKSRLGRLYNPLYFHGGIAIHGFPSVPPQPASHGCVRIPMSAAGWFPQLVPDGTPVYVVGAGAAGPRAT